jgi:indole-3-glycerol phosphate synthase
MTDILAEIIEVKRQEVAALRSRVSLATLEQEARAASSPRRFANALARAVQEGRYGLIAECKKASPSHGLIRPDYDPARIASAYQAGGATCLSVLTDTPWFQGEIAHLRAARATASLPVLRKDFMIDPLQVIEARAIGADCILLIMAALSDAAAAELESVALEWGLDVLIEVHDRTELERALRLRSPLVGINNRNLKTLQTTLDTSIDLASLLPPDRLAISESGLAGPEDLARMAEHGIHCFLVGESLMRQTDIGAATTRLLSRPA